MVDSAKKPPTLIPPDDDSNDCIDDDDFNTSSSQYLSSFSTTKKRTNNVNNSANSSFSTLNDKNQPHNSASCSTVNLRRFIHQNECKVAEIDLQLFQKSSEVFFDITSRMLYSENEDIIHRMEQLLFRDQDNDGFDDDCKNKKYHNDDDFKDYTDADYETMQLDLDLGKNISSSTSPSSSSSSSFKSLLLLSNAATSAAAKANNDDEIDNNCPHQDQRQQYTHAAVMNPNQNHPREIGMPRQPQQLQRMWVQHERDVFDTVKVSVSSSKNIGSSATTEKGGRNISMFYKEYRSIMKHTNRINGMIRSLQRMKMLHDTLFSDKMTCYAMKYCTKVRTTTASDYVNRKIFLQQRKQQQRRCMEQKNLHEQHETEI